MAPKFYRYKTVVVKYDAGSYDFFLLKDNNTQLKNRDDYRHNLFYK
jgi:hypothetical protein